MNFCPSIHKAGRTPDFAVPAVLQLDCAGHLVSRVKHISFVIAVVREIERPLVFESGVGKWNLIYLSVHGEGHILPLFPVKVCAGISGLPCCRF